MMHGNRSASTILYETQGVLRSVPNRPGSAAALQLSARRDLLRLQSALRLRAPLLQVFRNPA